MSKTSCWKDMILYALEANGETWGDVIKYTLTEEELLEKFNTGFGGAEGKPFTLWTTNWVYFPAVYDGAEWVESAPRNPCGTVTYHIGGQ